MRTNHCVGITLSFLLLLCLYVHPSFAQSRTARLSGVVRNASNGFPILGVRVKVLGDTAFVSTDVEGYFQIQLDSGRHILSFEAERYQTKQITGISLQKKDDRSLDLLLKPVYTQKISTAGINDSISTRNTNRRNLLERESKYAFYQAGYPTFQFVDQIGTRRVDRVDWQSRSLFSTVHQVIPVEQTNQPWESQWVLMGMSGRHSQQVINGMPMQALDEQAPFDVGMFPSQAWQRVQLQAQASASVVSGFSGGQLQASTRDRAVSNRGFVLLEGQFNTLSSTAFQQLDGGWPQRVGWAGAAGRMPDGFPNSRSRVSLQQLNLQAQYAALQSLPAGFQTQEQNLPLGGRLVLGLDRAWTDRHQTQWSFNGLTQWQENKLQQNAVVQVRPNTVQQPFPFVSNQIPVVRSQSLDQQDQQHRQSFFMANFSARFRNNRVSFRQLFQSTLFSQFTTRQAVSKPDEDSAARSAFHALREQRSLYMAQLTGSHAYGQTGALMLDWNLSYQYQQRYKPDETQILLRKRVNEDRYGFAVVQTLPFNPSFPSQGVESNFPNSGRHWFKDQAHAFMGSVDLKVPLNWLNQTSVLKGGLMMQMTYRNAVSDLFLHRGKVFFTRDSLLQPANYYPGGIDVQNYYVNTIRSSNNGLLYANNRGNFTGSTYYTAAYLEMLQRLSRKWLLQYGIRLESVNQLVSNVQYEYLEGYEEPQKISIDENAEVVSIKLLPSIKLMWEALRGGHLFATYYRTADRPALQELTAFRTYDPLQFQVRTGNPFLTTGVADHLEVGVQLTPSAQAHFSVSGFLKKWYQPIERVLVPYGSGTGDLMNLPYNMPEADTRGLQVSVRLGDEVSPLEKKRNQWSITAAVVYQEATVEGGFIKGLNAFIPEHTMANVPKWTANTAFLYQFRKGLGLRVQYAFIDDQLVQVGSGSMVKLSTGQDVLAIPHVWRKSNHQLEGQVSQSLLKDRLCLSAGATQLLKSPITWYQDLNGNGKMDDALMTTVRNQSGGFHASGTDNTPYHAETQIRLFFQATFRF